MITTATDFELIEKEKIVDLKFPDEDILSDSASIQERKLDLETALKLGNNDHHKIKIYFEDSFSKKMVETTVWGVTDKRVILKQGVVIPIHRIYRLKL
ncbi:MAG: hypothetical protein IPM51_06190 [Sphingobacteriaceae bacterium]|nr:hypothetical protein [Sphingobacteriaceae bacterium]